MLFKYLNTKMGIKILQQYQFYTHFYQEMMLKILFNKLTLD
jgi:hypothetical protein